MQKCEDCGKRNGWIECPRCGMTICLVCFMSDMHMSLVMHSRLKSILNRICVEIPRMLLKRLHNWRRVDPLETRNSDSVRLFRLRLTGRLQRISYLVSTFIGERQTCPYRLVQWGPWERKPNLDAWRRIGPDRVCSFCGSLHPEDFEKILDRALEKKDVSIDRTDSGGKWYVRRPEVTIAGQGGLKFKAAHQLGAEWRDRVNPKLRQAIQESEARLVSEMQEYAKKLQRDYPAKPDHEG